MTVEMARASGNSFYRIFRDQNHLAVYAYELEVSLTPNGQALRATAKPAIDQFTTRYRDADAGKPVPTLSANQEAGPLTSGQNAKFQLFEIPGVGLNVSETIRVKIGAEAGGGPLRFSGLRVAVDGKLIAGPASGGVAGKFAMFYIPGRGGYFFSAEPVPGRSFVPTGVTSQNRLDFTAENIDYQCLSTTAIQGIGGQLWVLHDASYKPAGNWTLDPQQSDRDQFFVAAADSLGWWLP